MTVVGWQVWGPRLQCWGALVTGDVNLCRLVKVDPPGVSRSARPCLVPTVSGSALLSIFQAGGWPPCGGAGVIVEFLGWEICLWWFVSVWTLHFSVYFRLYIQHYCDDLVETGSCFSCWRLLMGFCSFWHTPILYVWSAFLNGFLLQDGLGLSYVFAAVLLEEAISSGRMVLSEDSGTGCIPAPVGAVAFLTPQWGVKRRVSCSLCSLQISSICLSSIRLSI